MQIANLKITVKDWRRKWQFRIFPYLWKSSNVQIYNLRNLFEVQKVKKTTS
jgi:hypothetical protein